MKIALQKTKRKREGSGTHVTGIEVAEKAAETRVQQKNRNGKKKVKTFVQ